MCVVLYGCFTNTQYKAHHSITTVMNIHIHSEQ